MKLKTAALFSIPVIIWAPVLLVVLWSLGFSCGILPDP